jgi:hypothetical protein
VGGTLAVIERGWRGGDPCPLGVCRDLLNWVSCVYPPLRGVRDFVGNPYMIFYVYITIISGRNKYLKIIKSRQMRVASLGIQGSCKDPSS